MSSEKLRIHTAMPPEPAESETMPHARRRIFAQDKASSRRSRAQKDEPDSAQRVHVQKDETNSARPIHAQEGEANSAPRVHTRRSGAESTRHIRAQKGAPGSAQPIHWRCLPHPLQRRGLRRAGSPRPKLSAGDRMLRNTAVACALLLGVLALGNIRQPWAMRASETVQRALTMHIDLDSSIGRLSFVRGWMPESALVFFNLHGGAELAAPVSGELKHAYSDDQPWLLFACPEDSPVCAAADGTVTAVSELSGGSTGVLVDHGEGMETVYAYLSSASVQPGDAVSRGQALGQSAAQLYFELRQSEAAVDPTERMGLQ